MISQILIPVVAMAALGSVFGIGLASVLKIFKIEADPILALIVTKLPGANCGACGKAGCAGFAEALRQGEASLSSCVVASEETRWSIAEILGVECNPKVKAIATVLCNGGKNAKDKYIYRGIKSCKADSLLFGGHKACDFGCLGHGDCVRVCPVGAITMGKDDLPIINTEKCIACGNCIKACPKNLFELTSIKNNYYVKCNSKDPASVVAKICKSGCIACRKCEKVCPIGAIQVESNLSKINYEKCRNMGKCLEVCPTKVIFRR
ncbi:MAG: RnfABCDGE type electron transport complex subunit B [Candidatus Omnitrophica bacterium]|nr:RnfABCDGE type electron transport complex subunit B [Candidatus Omnitrophota bacterium]